MRPVFCNEKKNICIIAFPLIKAFEIPINNLSTILSFIYNTKIIIGTYDSLQIPARNNLNVTILKLKQSNSIVIRVLRYFILNIRIIIKMIFIYKNVDMYIFFMELPPIFQMLILKILHKKILWILPSNIKTNDIMLFNNHLKKICFLMSNRIVLFSYRLVQEWHLEDWKNKIIIAHNHYIDFKKFKIIKPYYERKRLVGYVGRLSKEKGILEFIMSLPILIKNCDDIEFVIIGDGQYKKIIEMMINKLNLCCKIRLIGWVSHTQLPLLFNEMKLIVMPSYTEGLPNVAIEAMACGTPVLATPVGAIPDIIEDCKTGFLLDNNSPECIANHILRALGHPNLEKIAENARLMVKNKFTFEKTTSHFIEILKI